MSSWLGTRWRAQVWMLCLLGFGVLGGTQSAHAQAAAMPPSHAPHEVGGYQLPRMWSAGTLRAVTPADSRVPPGPFPFETARSDDGRIIVHTYSVATNVGQGVVALAQADLQHPIHDILGFDLLRPVNVYVYNSRADFLLGAPVTNPAETSALTQTDQSTVYFVLSQEHDALPHELTHVVFHQNEDTGRLESSYFGFFPLWLDEGLAAYDQPANSSQVDKYQRAVHDAVSAHALVDLFQNFNTDYPPDPNTNFLAYAEARSFIGYLVGNYGAQALHTFLNAAHDGQFLTAAMISFGADLRVLESRWEVSLGLPARVADAGYAPVFIPQATYSPGTLPALMSQTHPFPTVGGDPIPQPLWLLFGGLMLLALAVLVKGLYANPVARARPVPEMALRAPYGSYTPDLLREVGGIAPLARAVPTSGTEQPSGVGSLDTTMPATPRRSTRWYDLLLTLLPAPLALGIGILAVQRDPLHAWGTGYAAAGAVGGVSFLLTLWLLWQTRAARPLRFVVGLLTLLLLLLPLLQAATADLQQAEIYEGLGAYTLALRLDAAAGPNEQGIFAQVRVRTKWAQAASARQDYATATTQWRAALALDPWDVQVGGKHAALVATTHLWSEALAMAHEYDAALRVTANEAHSPSCDAACQPQLRVLAADTYLQWVNMLLLAGNTAKALETLQLLIQNYPTTPSAGIARQALSEVQALDALDGAVAAGAGGDHAAMNTQLVALAAKYPATMAAAEAAEVPEPVDGRIVDYSGASVNGDRLFLLAFSSEAQARGFQYNFTEDTSAFKVATTLGAGGSFTALLPPGYWYVATWEDATLARYGYLNVTIDWMRGNDAFTVRPFTPSSAGTIVGF